MYKRFSHRILDRIEVRLKKLYPKEYAGLTDRLVYTIGRYGAGGENGPRHERWNENDVALITYGDTVKRLDESQRVNPLVSLRRFCSKELRGAVSTVHILPFYPWSSDDGFSVIDYREVDPELGNWQDVEDLGKEFDLMFDLVLNHCSSESSWFKDFVSGIQPGRHYFLEMDPGTDTSRVVRPRTSPLLTKTPTRDGGAYVWTTFSADQVDLNWQNPDLLFEFIDIILLYISKGVRILRMDAVAFLWKKLGTSCIHLPETHEMVKLLRDICELIDPNVLVLTETNVPQDENLGYFGDSDEAHMVYNFSLPPLLLHGLLRNDASHLTRWVRDLPDPPPGCTYFNFTSSHDGIGVRPLTGLLPDGELTQVVRDVLARDGRISYRTGADGKEEPYELNITYFDALRDPESEERSIARFLCSQALMLSLRGVPAVYFHCLTATPNHIEGVEQTGHNRTINRMKWDEAKLKETLADPENPQARVFEAYIRMLRRRSNHRAFHPDGSQQILDLGPAIFGLIRRAPDRSEWIVCVYNFTGREQIVKNPLDTEAARKVKSFYDIISGKTYGSGRVGVRLEPYQALWLIPRMQD